MTKQKVIAWGLGLLVISIAGAYLMNTDSATETNDFWLRLGTSFSLGGPAFFNTGAIAGIYYYLKRDAAKAMWAWTGLLLAAYILLLVGGVEWGNRGFGG